MVNSQHQQEDSDSAVGGGVLSRSSTIGPKLKSSACQQCKSLKVRCEFTPGANTCQRCQAGSYPCIPRDRKKRKSAPTHEDLQAKVLSQDLKIQELLLQFDRLRRTERLRGIMSRASVEGKFRNVPMDHWKSISLRGSTEESIVDYFGNEGTTCICPDIVRYCELHPQDILSLFSIFFERINPYFSILDPELHTPQNLIWTSPFLFTVICSTASRYYDQRPGLYDISKDLARDAAGRALIDGSKSIEVCQAYLIMGVYPVPKKKWAEDRSWLFMGVAIRMAMELKLNRPPPPTLVERDRLNRVRTWLNCYCVDGSHAIQFGKPPMLRLDDYLALHSLEWYKSSSLNIPYDVHLCAYVEILIFMSEWRALTGADLTQRVANDLNVTSEAILEQEKLASVMDKWRQIYDQELQAMPLPICAYRGNTTQLIAAYLRLVILALGFQHSVKEHLLEDCTILRKSLEAGQATIQIMVEHLYPTGYLRYAMEAHFVCVAFAAAFMLNLLRPRFVVFLSNHQQRDIIQIVGSLVEVLRSEEVSIDGRHTPALYAKFLQSLLDKHHPAGSIEDLGSGAKSDDEGRQETLPDACFWPDIQYSGATASTVQPRSRGSGMDFSISHFVQVISRDGATAQQAPNDDSHHHHSSLYHQTGTEQNTQWRLPTSWSQVQWGVHTEDFEELMY